MEVGSLESGVYEQSWESGARKEVLYWGEGSHVDSACKTSLDGATTTVRDSTDLQGCRSFAKACQSHGL